MGQVIETLTAINQAWRQHQFSDMEALLDENVVMRGPKLKEYARGRKAFVQTYAQFMEQSHITEYSESNHITDMWGDIAAVTYNWTMTYEQKGQTKTDSGQDMFVFHRAPTGWVAVLRVIFF